jgi:hypothetical protein
MQPQGLTGPIDTITGGPPAESPQGETPGMQVAPEGSSKTIVDPKTVAVDKSYESLADMTAECTRQKLGAGHGDA